MSVYRPTYKDPKTGEKCESEIWWCDFTYKRRRVRESTGQTKKTLAKEYETRRRRELENEVAGVPKSKPEDRIQDLKTIIEAFKTIASTGKRERTRWFIRDRCAHLIEHFGSKLACDVTEGSVAEYIAKREAAGIASVSINREVALLCRALKVDRKHAWPNLGRSKRKTNPVGKAITEAEEAALLVAAGGNRSKYALPFIGAALYTGFRADELRTLRWRQIDFLEGWIQSERSKTEAGEFREVAMLPELRHMLLAHRAWIEKKLGRAPDPDHYVFPFTNRGKPVDPERPCTSIASSWYRVREDAGVTCRLHDLRHTYVTRLIEGGASDAIVRELVGHVDRYVVQRYTHIRRRAKEDAIRRAFAKSPDVHVKDSPKEASVSEHIVNTTEQSECVKIQ